MTEPFSEKLTLTLKLLSMSRADLAAELGLDKSVVARWAAGVTVPSAHNLGRLSAFMARTIPGFSTLDWDRDMQSLAGLFGVEAGRATATVAEKPRTGLALPFLDQILSTTALRAGAYQGFYRSTRPYAGQPGLFIHDHSLVRLGPDGLLLLKMSTGGVNVEGWMLPIHNQLFIIGAEFTGGALVFAILHGVNSVKADVLDGITLSSNHDAGRSPAAAPVVHHRIGELTEDPVADDTRLAELAAANPVALEGSIPEALRRRLARDIGPAQTAFGGDGVLRWN